MYEYFALACNRAKIAKQCKPCTKLELIYDTVHSQCQFPFDFISCPFFPVCLHSHAEVERIQKSSRMPVLDVDLAGVKSIKAIPLLESRFLFISPPSITILVRDLVSLLFRTIPSHRILSHPSPPHPSLPPSHRSS